MKIGKITLDDEINRSIGDVISDGLSGVVIDELGTVIISGEFGTVVSRESVSAIIRIKGLVVQIDVSTDVDNNDGVNSGVVDRTQNSAAFSCFCNYLCLKQVVIY